MTSPHITGKSRIGHQPGAALGRSFSALNPAEAKNLPERFYDASPREVDEALLAADRCHRAFRSLSATKRSEFLEHIAGGIEEHQKLIVGRAHLETALGEARIQGELARTTAQLRMFAALVREGSWVEAVIDSGNPARRPSPKPDIRKMRVALGPIIVFAAGNFPLAFSVAGGDTASALAAGNPVVVKAHSGHPGTSELVADVILAAADETGMPEGVFSMIHGSSFDPGNSLVMHERTAAVAFTGSFQGGMALFRLAQERRRPIPVFAEMGSTNPIVVLPEILRADPARVAALLCDSVTLGGGQFCTKPGIIVVRNSEGLDQFERTLASVLETKAGQPLLGRTIAERFDQSLRHIRTVPAVRTIFDTNEWDGLSPSPFVGEIDSADFLEHPELHDETFGPFALIVACNSLEAMIRVVESFEGQLTMTVHGTEEELRTSRELTDRMEERAGRLICGGVPTGVEVCSAMQHGGPYPASTDGRFTSVGHAAIQRFTRPVAFQDWPDSLLPPELCNANPRHILRSVDGTWTREPITAGGA